MAWFGRDRSAFHIGEFTGLLVDYCREHSIQFNIRGLRAMQDFNYEFEMHGMNCDMAPEINTVFLVALAGIPVRQQHDHQGARQASVASGEQICDSVRRKRIVRRKFGHLAVFIHANRGAERRASRKAAIRFMILVARQRHGRIEERHTRHGSG
jgi:hypothetical protein